MFSTLGQCEYAMKVEALTVYVLMTTDGDWELKLFNLVFKCHQHFKFTNCNVSFLTLFERYI